MNQQGNQGNQAIYVCRLCQPPFEITPNNSYNNLRAHLRAQHGILHMQRHEVNLYETYPGSRFTQYPFLSQQNVGNDPNVDVLINVRTELIQAVSASVAENVRHIALPAAQVDIGPILTAFNQMRDVVVNTIGNGIKDGIKVAITELAEQLDSNSRLSNTSIGPNGSVNQLNRGGDHDDMPELVPIRPPPNVSGEVSTVSTTGNRIDVRVQVDELNAENTTTKSDEELLDVSIPEMVSVEQIQSDLNVCVFIFCPYFME